MNLSRLPDSHESLVADASVVINILGTGNPLDVLKPLGRPLVVEEIAFREVRRDPFTKSPATPVLAALMEAGVLARGRMSESAYLEFLSLVAAPTPDGLDDGEAATLAYTVELGATAIVDEKRGTKIAGGRYPQLTVLTTLDVLSCPQIVAAISADQYAEMVFNALVKAHMSVPVSFRPWVISVIGPERAKMCPNLGTWPRYALNK